MVVITTERMILRRWRREDRVPLAQINADARVMEFQPAVLSREQSDCFVEYMEGQFREHGFCLYATELRHNQQFVGFIGIHVPTFQAAFTPCVEIGWRLAADVWGQGLATEGGRAVLQHSFEVLKLDEIVSFTAAINTRAQRVMQKLGMTRDPAEDFDHPKLPEGYPLRRHVLYRMPQTAWRSLHSQSTRRSST